MAFFSLTAHQEHQQRDQTGPESLFLYRNNEDNSLYKSFELWQPQHQQQQQQFQEYDFYSAARTMSIDQGRVTGQQGLDDGPSGSGLEMMMSGGGGLISCQDCGNQAKKDCLHMRCRTCCKSRGFNCRTHVRSTWVPASVRRKKQHQQPQLLPIHKNIKKQGEKRSSSSTAGLQVGDLPPEFTSTETFCCVSVSSINDAYEEYAYQTTVNIGGHTFKGILYDQGPDNKDYTNLPITVETSGAGVTSPTVALFDNCNYPSPFGTFNSATPFVYNPRS